MQSGDTLAKLVTRITAATGGRAAATVVTTGGYDRLQIAPATSQAVLKLTAGPVGSDALKALGLAPTLITTAQSSAKAPTAAPYALSLTGTYSLTDTASAKAAFAAVAVAVTAVHKAYTDMTAPAPTPGKTGGTRAGLPHRADRRVPERPRASDGLQLTSGGPPQGAAPSRARAPLARAGRRR